MRHVYNFDCVPHWPAVDTEGGSLYIVTWVIHVALNELEASWAQQHGDLLRRRNQFQ